MRGAPRIYGPAGVHHTTDTRIRPSARRAQVGYTTTTPMTADDRRGGRFPAWRTRRRPRAARCASPLIVALLLVTPVSAQPPVDPDTPAMRVALLAARTALNEGRFDALAAATRPYLQDPRMVALAARGEIQRGRYAEAEKVLQPVASAAPASDAAVEFGLLQQRLGRRDEAAKTLDGVLSSLDDTRAAEAYARAGRAAQALGQFQDANTFFREAAAALPADPQINTWWGELLLAKHNRPDAARSFLAALGADATWVDAQVGLARVTAEDDPPRAKAMAEQALATNPSSVGAHLVLAELALDAGRTSDAKTALARALQINPNSLEAIAIDAAMAFLDARLPDYQTAVARALRIDAGYGEVYRVIGEQLAHHYRFDEAVEMTERATAIDDQNARAAADLGMHRLRTGDEAGARRALDAAFRNDPYDVVAYNLLALLDTLDTFVTVRQGDLIVRLQADEAPVLREYVPALAEQALERLSAKYQFKPKGPILVEVFPKHDDFAVRTLGLPGMIGALGACFGRVVTMDSPKARPPGTFNWGATLWHEMAHVITLQMSNARVPRWLTEGISVWEEKQARPEWGRDQDLMFAEALEKGQALSVRDLNSGFSSPQLISMAYFEASLLVDHLVTAYGQPAMFALLRSYGAGLETEAAIKAVYGVTPDQLQAGFTEYLRTAFGPLRAALAAPEIPAGATRAELVALARRHPSSFAVQMALAEQLAGENDDAGAIAQFERAAALVPVATGKESPHARIAEIARARGDRARAARAYEAVLEVDHTDVESARALAALVDPGVEPARSERAWSRVAGLDPFDIAAHTALGRFALARRDAPAAVRAFRVALAGRPPDRAAAHYDLAQAYLLAGDRKEAKRQTLYALEIAPAYEPAQALLLALVEGA